MIPNCYENCALNCAGMFAAGAMALAGPAIPDAALAEPLPFLKVLFVMHQNSAA